MRVFSIFIVCMFLGLAVIPQLSAKHHHRSRHSSSFGVSFNFGSNYIAPPPVVVAPPAYVMAPTYTYPYYATPVYATPVYSVPVMVERPCYYVQPGYVSGYSYSYRRY